MARILVAFALVLITALPASAAVAPQVVTSPGGITAWLVEDHTNPIIALRLSFRGSGALVPDGKEGLAKMVASTIDEGASDIDSQTFQGRLDDLSITLRFTAGLETFGGRLTTLTENRDEAFRLLSLALTQPRFDEEPVERIRRQILAGLRRDAEDPDEIASRTLFETLYPDHPYRKLVDGTLETVPAVTVADMRRFVAERFARDNLVIGVVGDITPAELAPLLDQTFGALPAEAAPWTLPEVAPAAGGKAVIIEHDVPQSSIQFAQAAVKRHDPDFWPLYVMNHILGRGGFTSRLFDEVREKRGLAYSVSTGVYTLEHSSLIIGSAGTANARAGETVTVIRDEWRRMAEKGVSETEVADAKTYLTGSFPLRFSSSGRIAAILVAMQLDDLGVDYLEKRNDYIAAVSRDDVDRVAARYLTPGKLLTVVVGRPEGVE